MRVSFGIYVRPELSQSGPARPILHHIAEAEAKRDDAELSPHGTTAENHLGFSTQVPMNIVYLTSGTPRKLKIGNRTIVFNHRVPSTSAFKGKRMPVLVLALQSIGNDNMDDATLSTNKKVLSEHPENDTWQSDIAHAPAWIRK